MTRAGAGERATHQTGEHRPWAAALACPAVAGTVVIAALLSGAPIACADDLQAIRDGKLVKAVRIDQPIRLDGVLSESAWKLAEPARDFYQQQPAEFEPATHRTEVRFVYDDDTLYVGVVLHDEAPAELVINDLKRDFSGNETDMFGLVLDTFLDRRNAYGFLVNPGGAQRDTQAYDNGRRNDPNWHGVWSVRTAIRPDGWSAEYAIPFKTLRFPDRPVQEWGLNLVRMARRANEKTTWSPVPRQFSHYNVAYAGRLVGISGIGRGRNLQVTPFATAHLEPGPSRGDEPRKADGGVDLKWGVAPSLVLDATYRTDFSQVEADTQQINLTRFGLFFPEQRSFFLENPASFQIGIAEGDDDNPRRDLVPFFSRRIGLSADGQPIDVIGGLRLTGRAGAQTLGLLNMQTDSFDGQQGDNFTALNVARSMSDAVSVGAFYFGRESAGNNGFNRVAGLDLRLSPSRMLQIAAFAMHSSTQERSDDWAGQADVRVDTSGHRLRVGFVQVDAQFRHDLGFVHRQGIATLFGRYTRVLRLSDAGSRVLEYTLGTDVELTGDDRHRRWLTRVGGLNYGMLFADGGEFRAWANTTSEQLDAPFGIGPILTVTPGAYRFQDFGGRYTSNKSATISGSVEAKSGGFWSGHKKAVEASLRLRFSSRVAASGTVSRNTVTLPAGSFTGNLLGLRLDTSFTPRMFLNAFVQYNSEAQAWLSNVRYNLIHHPLSDLYIVWNETRVPGVSQRALLLKFTQTLVF